MKHITINALLLRHLRITCGDAPLEIRLKKAQALLFYLLVQKKATRDELTGLLWSGEDEELARRHLRDNLYHLKKVSPVELIVPVDRSTLQLNPELEFHIDIDEFLSSSDIEPYQGEFLHGFAVPNCYEYEEWLEQTRTSLREVYLQRLDKQAEICLSAGKGDEAEALWRKYLQEEPLCEAVSVSLMQLYRTRRDYSRAALIYRSLHKAMSDALGIAPLKETLELYYAIMQEWNDLAESDDISDDFLVGRQEHLQSLLRLFSHGHRTKCAKSFIIRGEAGVEKSHLLTYFLSHGGTKGYEVITTSCFRSKQDEYLYPWQTLMLSLVNYIEKEHIVIPEACLHTVGALFPALSELGDTEVEKKSHLLVDSVLSFDSTLTLLSLVAKKRPLLLVIEDIQWMDHISLMLLDQMLHKINSGEIVFAATCRQPAADPVTNFLRSAEEDGLCRCCDLSPFTHEETMQFIELCGAQSIPQADKEQIYRDTQGNAFLLTQLIGSIMENGQPKVMPRNMEEILSYRLSGLSSEGRQVLNLVAMFPSYAPCNVLEAVSSKPTLDLLYVCQELCRRAILNEVFDGGTPSLVFTQAEFRDLTYAHIPALSRRILHLNIAQALTALDSSSQPNLDTLTAYHYEQGGDMLHAFEYRIKRFKTYVCFNYALLSDAPRGSETLLDTTPQAMEVFARMEKELHDLQRRYPSEPMLAEAEADLYYSVGCFCIYRGRYDDGVKALEHLISSPNTPDDVLDLAHEQMTYYGIQTYQTDVMRQHIDAALRLTDGKNAARYAINRRYNGYRLVMEGQYEEGREELLRALILLHEALTDDAEQRLQSAYAHDYIGESYRKQGMYTRAIEEYRTAIREIGSYLTSTTKPMFYVDWAMAALAQGDYAAARNALAQSDSAADEIKELSSYYMTPFCIYSALFAFADRDYAKCAEYLIRCRQMTDTLVVPYDKGILHLVEAIIRRRCDVMHSPVPVLEACLTESCADYCAQSRQMLEGRTGIFEMQTLEALESGSTDPIPGLFAE